MQSWLLENARSGVNLSRAPAPPIVVRQPVRQMGQPETTTDQPAPRRGQPSWITPRLLRTLTIIFLLLVLANVIAYVWVNGETPAASNAPASAAPTVSLVAPPATIQPSIPRIEPVTLLLPEPIRAYSGQELAMNADAFRHLYEYHFTINRKIWDQCIVPLPDEAFTRDAEYSMGSVRNQVVHLLNIDERWFSGLRGMPLPDFIDPTTYPTKPLVRAKWDQVEADMRAYLADLRDDMLMKQPFGDALQLWQVLIHVANHGTDHRAQTLALLHQLGVETFPQDHSTSPSGKCNPPQPAGSSAHSPSLIAQVATSLPAFQTSKVAPG